MAPNKTCQDKSTATLQEKQAPTQSQISEARPEKKVSEKPKETSEQLVLVNIKWGQNLRRDKSMPAASHTISQFTTVSSTGMHEVFPLQEALISLNAAACLSRTLQVPQPHPIFSVK